MTTSKKQTNWIVIVIITALIGVAVNNFAGCTKATANKIMDCPEMIQEVKSDVKDNEKDIFNNSIKLKEQEVDIKQAKEAAIRAELKAAANHELLMILIERK